MEATPLRRLVRSLALAATKARALGALLAGLACAGAQAGDMVLFPASVGYTASEVTLRAELHRPEGPGPFPAVVLMHGCGGWQPAVRFTMQGYAEQFVRSGFVVLDLDSFGPRRLGNGKVCESVPKQQDALQYRTHDAYDALRYLQSQGFVDAANVFLMGQSNGGSVAIKVAKGEDLQDARGTGAGFRGVVAYYPWCGPFEGRRQVHLAAPLLVFAGGRDDWVPARECQGVRSSGAELDVIVYPEAAHSFDLDIVPQRYLGNLVGKEPFAAEDSRRRMLGFFMRFAGERTARASAL
ncbi:MAG TPA: alpha/beta family hydrolase [Ramlibacter sp.]|uniref:dienelactone hydrolase family protein n=1 Tax=Ramlibacter sp. TaxID=1917967 RepID=UPI002D7F7E00|nr:alpha/beta family hydrolase [Ramlibacter sp.]HET8746391.1 alpha/beta family hydrolase [Ramlibacter sp.]